MFHYMAGYGQRGSTVTIQVSSPGNWHAYTLREPVGGGSDHPVEFPAWRWRGSLRLRALAAAMLHHRQLLLSRPPALRLGELVQEAGVPVWSIS